MSLNLRYGLRGTADVDVIHPDHAISAPGGKIPASPIDVKGHPLLGSPWPMQSDERPSVQVSHVITCYMIRHPGCRPKHVTVCWVKRELRKGLSDSFRVYFVVGSLGSYLSDTGARLSHENLGQAVFARILAVNTDVARIGPSSKST